MIDDAGWGHTQITLFSGNALGAVVAIVGQAKLMVVRNEIGVVILYPEFLEKSKCKYKNIKDKKDLTRLCLLKESL